MCLRSQRGCQDPSVLRVGVRAAPLAVAAERALRAPASRAQRAHALPARPRPSEVAWRRAYLHRSRDAARRASALRCTWRRLRSGSRHVASFSWVIGLAMLTWARLLLGLALLLAVRAETEHTREDGPCHSLLDLETDYVRDGETQAIAAHRRLRLRPLSRWLAHARPRARRYSTSSTQRPQSSALTARRRSVSARASVRRLHCGPRAPLRAPRAALAL